MANEIDIQLQARLHDQSLESIKEQIDALQKILDGKPLEIKIDSKIVSTLNNFVDSMKNFEAITKKSINTTKTTGNALKEQKQNVDKLTNSYDELGRLIRQIDIQDNARATKQRQKTYQAVDGTKTTVYQKVGALNTYRVVTENLTPTQQQNKNFKEAIIISKQLAKVREQILKLDDLDIDKQETLNKQATSLYNKYLAITKSRKVMVGKENIGAINQEQIKTLEQLQKTQQFNLDNIVASRSDKARREMDNAFITTERNRRAILTREAKVYNKTLLDNYKLRLKQQEELDNMFYSLEKSRRKKALEDANINNKIQSANYDQNLKKASLFQSNNYKYLLNLIGQREKLETKLVKLGSADSDSKREVIRQIKLYGNEISNILNTNIKIKGIEDQTAINDQQELNLLRQIESAENRILLVKKEQNDQALRKVSTTVSGRRSLGEEVILHKPININASTKELDEYARAVGGINAEWTKVTPKFDSAGNKIKELNVRTKEGGKYWRQWTVTLDETTGKLYKVDRGLTDVSSRQLTFIEQFKIALQRVPLWMSAMTIYYGALRSLQAGIRYITEIDTALTNLNKVTDETRETLKNFGIEANNIGYHLAKTTDEVINATTEFARLGYNLNQAKVLAQQALLYSNVGDIDVETASLAIISAVKGFGVAVDEQGRNVQRLVDIYNEVGNNYAISSAGIGEAMQRSAASLYGAGNTIEQAVAMITAANAVVQDPSVVGTALKTVSMRLRGVTDEGEEIQDLVPKLQKSFRDIGIEIKKDNDTFKSTYEIMNDLSKVWNDLTDIQQANITELVAGKRQGNIVVSMLNNWKDATDSLNTALNSENSALIENQKYMESIEARVAQFRNTLQKFWQTSIDKGTITNIVEFGTTLMNVFTGISKTMGLLPAVIFLVTTAFIGLNNTIRKSIMETEVYRGKLITLKGTFALLGNAAKSTGLFLLRAIPVAAIVTAISLIIGKLFELIVTLNKSKEEFKKTLLDSIGNIKVNESEIAKAKELQIEYEKLNKLTVLTTSEKDKLKSVQNELINIFPNLRHEIDAEGNAIIANTKAIQDNIDAKEEESNKLKTTLANAFKISERFYREEIDKTTKSIKQKQDKIALLQSELELQNKLNISYDPMGVFKKDNYDKFSTEILEATSELQKQVNFFENAMLAVLQTDKEFKNFNTSILYDIIDLYKELNKQNKDLGFFDFIEKFDPSKLKSFQSEINKFIVSGKTKDDIKELNKSYDLFFKYLVEIYDQFGYTGQEAENLAHSFIKTQYPIEITKIALNKLTSALEALRDKTTTSVNDMVLSLNILGIAVSEQVQGMLSDYASLILGIKSVADAQGALASIIKDEVNKTDLPQGMIAHSSNINEMEFILNRIGQAWEDINKLKDDPLIKDDPTGKEFNKLFEVWKEKLEAINRELNILTDQLEDVTSFEHKTEIYDKMLLLLRQKESLLLEISRTFASDLQKAEQHLKSFIGKGLSQSDFNKIISGSTDVLEINIKNEKLSEAIELFRKLRDGAESVKKELISIDNEIRKTSFDKYKNILSLEDDKISDLTQQRNNLRNEMSLLEKGGQDYITLLQEEDIIIKQLINSIQNKIALSQKELLNDKYNAEQKKEIINTIKTLKQEYIELQFAVKQELASIADEVISIYKEMYEKQKDVALNSIDEQMEAEEKRHKKVIENIDDEASKFEEYINDKIKALDREESKRDYQRDLDKKQRERQELVDKISLLSMDNSIEAKLQLSDLNKKLSEKEEEIAEMQHDHSIDLRKENLKDQLDAYKKDIDSKKKAEETKYNLEKERLERIKRDTERYYDELINDERRFAQIRYDIINGNINQVKSAFDTLKSFINSNMVFIGNSIGTNLIARMQQAIALLDSYSSRSSLMPDQSSDIYPSPSPSPSTPNQGRTPIAIIDANKYENANGRIIMPSRDIAAALGASVDWSGYGDSQRITIGGKVFKPHKIVNNVSYLGIREVAEALGHEVEWDEVSKKIKVYHSGGVVGDKPPELIDKINKFFNTDASENVIKALTNEILTPPKNIVQYFIPNMQKLTSSIVPQVQIAGAGDTIYNLNLRIDSVVGNKEGGQTVFKEIVKGLKSFSK